jgi:Zn-dependent protease with chaperone function
MFIIRGIALSFTVFVLLYVCLSVLVSWGWGIVARISSRFSPGVTADLLFALRVLPVGLSALATLVFMVPSFLLLEPHSIDEPIGAVPLTFGFCGVILVVVGALKATAAQVRTSQIVTSWLSDATAIAAGAAVPLFRTGRGIPALTAAGILGPKVLISEAATAVLSESELRTALRHEVAHVRRRDNLKKLLFCFCAFPRMAQLEKAWSEAAEMAADDAAVDSSWQALDLASALIKLSRLPQVSASPALTTALLHASATAMNARIERLIGWDDASASTDQFSLWYALLPAFGIVVCAAVTYNAMLNQLHLATEWLVR